MHIDWRSLRSHIPTDPGDEKYVGRPDSPAERIVAEVRAGHTPLLVGGPAGVGRSSEIATASELLKKADRVSCLARIDRKENMRRLTPERMCLHYAHFLSVAALDALQSEPLEEINRLDDIARGMLEDPTSSVDANPRVLLSSVLDEISRLSKGNRAVMLIDGLEKLRRGDQGLLLFEVLGEIRSKVDLVLSVPWYSAFGPRTDTLICPEEHFLPVRALDVDRPDHRAVLFAMLEKRLGWESDAIANASSAAAKWFAATEDADIKPCWNLLVKIINDAAACSGGMPRLFLQILGGTGGYSSLLRNDPFPIVEEFEDACANHIDSFRRLLLEGDVEAIFAAIGTSGSELGLPRRIRLMAHAILLERVRDGNPVLDLTPLARESCKNGGRRA